MSLEQEKFKKEFEQYKKNTDERIQKTEARQKNIYEGLVSLKNKMTSMVSPIDLKLKQHLRLHELWFNIGKYLFLIVSGAIAFFSNAWSFFKDIFK